MSRKETEKRRTPPSSPIPLDDSAMERLLMDIRLHEADRSFTDYDYTMVNEMSDDPRMITRFFLTFNNSADGNNPAERE